MPTTYLRTSAFWENLIYFGLGPQRGEDGALAITYPVDESRVPGIGAEDIGKIALGIFKAGDAYLGETVSVAGEHLTGAEMAAKLARALGEDVRATSRPTSSAPATSSSPDR